MFFFNVLPMTDGIVDTFLEIAQEERDRSGSADWARVAEWLNRPAEKNRAESAIGVQVGEKLANFFAATLKERADVDALMALARQVRGAEAIWIERKDGARAKLEISIPEVDPRS